LTSPLPGGRRADTESASFARSVSAHAWWFNKDKCNKRKEANFVKHLLIISFAVLSAYVIWAVISPIERRQGMRLIGKHALRLGVIIALVLVLLVFSYYVPSINIL
jgi:hypothetical protein